MDCKEGVIAGKCHLGNGQVHGDGWPYQAEFEEDFWSTSGNGDHVTTTKKYPANEGIAKKRASLFKLPVQNSPRPLAPLKSKPLPIPAIDEKSPASHTRYEKTAKARRSGKAR